MLVGWQEKFLGKLWLTAFFCFGCLGLFFVIFLGWIVEMGLGVCGGLVLFFLKDEGLWFI